ncbi:MAG: hypothetical protein KatS3mg110_2271 [Pirellulaceae bacterium]|nr:MAG: hypothetical protein KatS3mg110_2271 [Pirellulaceae bacterium]
MCVMTKASLDRAVAPQADPRLRSTKAVHAPPDHAASSGRLLTGTRPAWPLFRLVFAVATLIASAGAALADHPRIVAIHMGVDNTAKVGHWTAVTVVVENGSSPFKGYLEIRAPDSEGLPAAWQAAADDGSQKPIELAAGQRTEFIRYLRLGRLQGNLEALLRSGKQT